MILSKIEFGVMSWPFRVTATLRICVLMYKISSHVPESSEHPITSSRWKRSPKRSHIVPHLTTSDGTARVPPIHYRDATSRLKSIDILQDNALAVSVSVPSELVTCRIPHQQ
jgi:hypothetical protein